MRGRGGAKAGEVVLKQEQSKENCRGHGVKERVGGAGRPEECTNKTEPMACVVL